MVAVPPFDRRPLCNVRPPRETEAGLAALNPELRLAGVLQHRAGRYRLVREGLGDYLVPRRGADATAEHIRRTGRGIAYTRSAFAYVFTRR